jgi:hypothetical protein
MAAFIFGRSSGTLQDILLIHSHIKIMSQKQQVAPWIAQRIVQFFNQVQKPIDIILGVLDDPGDNEMITFTMSVARRILKVREQLPGQQFETLEQIDKIAGVGDDKIEDLVYTFGKPAAEVFERALFDENVLYENWTLRRFEWKADTSEMVQIIRNDEAEFRRVVRQLAVQATMELQGVSEADALAATASIETDYIDTYTNSTAEASYALALWFYRVDADNWFEHEEILDHAGRYFDYHYNPYGLTSLHLFKGFDNHILLNLVVPNDLAVTVNDTEQVVTLWVLGLAD